MAITKTDFIEYTRCRRYPALEELRKDKLSSDMTLEEYFQLEDENEKKELLQSMFEINEDEEETDLTRKENKQLEALMKYYKQVEIEASKIVSKRFGGNTFFSRSTFGQESFDFTSNGIRYLCYVDIYNEDKEVINIIEVKSTTCSEYREMTYSKRMGEKYPLFVIKDGILNLSKCLSDDPLVIKNYEEKKNNLKNRFNDVGKYIYDLAVQRFIIENDHKSHNINKEVHYYLAVLNSEYIYDGYMENGEPVYSTVNNEDIITIINMDEITYELMDKINNDKKILEKNIFESDDSVCPLGEHCAFKKNTECKYKMICYKNVPSKNASFNYLNFRRFKDENGLSYNKYDLLNNGYLKFDDIPYNWLSNANHIIQRNAYDNNITYIDEEKIVSALKSIEYPIYHLDFETFACPLPRFKGEKPYTQSCFEFSLHIERFPGVCDKEKDNYVFLAETFNDEREKLVKMLVDKIDINKGTMLAQNVTFERGRLTELANVFPKYKSHLLKIRDNSFDLLYIIQNNSRLFSELGFDEERCKKVNYYNINQSGSYSIKKTLPLFTDLKYDDLAVQNGNEAQVAYSQFNTLDNKKLTSMRNSLIEYCKQDTWAMVEILKGLRKLVNEVSKVM